jgi:hypothetical protein
LIKCIFIKNGIKVKLFIRYNEHYCLLFKNKKNSWKFEMFDWLAEDIGKEVNVKVDELQIIEGNITETPFRISVPVGPGEHFIEIEE